MNHASRWEQLTLFGGGASPEPSPAPPAPAQPAVKPAEPRPVDPRQQDLFADRVLLLTGIDQAMAQGEFEEAIRLRQVLAHDHGPAGVPAELAVLDRFAGWTFERGGASGLLTLGRQASEELPSPRRRAALLDAVYSRLLRSLPVGDVVALAPESLPHVFRTLVARGDEHAARCLVRDYLLSGADLAPFDGATADVSAVLAEPEEPAWLACMGALRDAWPVPLLDGEECRELAARTEAWVPEPGRDPGLAFWDCLRVAASRRSVGEPAVHAARRLMRALDAGLHAEYMRRAF